MSGFPPLPPGFTLDAPAQNAMPPLPEGFSLDSPDTLTDVAKSAGIGVVKGGIGLAGLPGDLSELGARGLDYATRSVGKLIGQDIAPRPAQEPLGGSSQIQGAVEGLTGKFYEPKTTAGHYAQSVGEMIPAVAGGPETLATKFLTRAAVPGLASEGAGQLTNGSAVEPVARFAGALAGGVGASKLAAPAKVAAPTVEALEDAAKTAYNHPTVKGLALKPSSVDTAAADIKQSLFTSGLDENVAPMTFKVVEKLSNPVGNTANISDIDNVRKVLGKIAGNFATPIEQGAARQAISKIDDYLANIKQADVIAGDAASASSILKEARANYAAKMRTDKIDAAEYRGELNAGSAHSGDNINNATRQAIKSILLSPAKSRGFSAEEIAQMEKVVKGTATANTLRAVGKLLATTGMHGAAVLGGSFAAVPATGGMSLLAPAAGFLAKKASNAMTSKEIQKLNDMVAMRSPLGKSMPARLPSTNPLISGLLSGISGR